MVLPAVLSDRPVVDLSGLPVKRWLIESALFDRLKVYPSVVRLNSRYAVLAAGRVYFLAPESKASTPTP